MGRKVGDVADLKDERAIVGVGPREGSQERGGCEEEEERRGGAAHVLGACSAGRGRVGALGGQGGRAGAAAAAVATVVAYAAAAAAAAAHLIATSSHALLAPLSHTLAPEYSKSDSKYAAKESQTSTKSLWMPNY